MSNFVHKFIGYTIKSRRGFINFIAGKETYIVMGITYEKADLSTPLSNGKLLYPGIVCDQKFNQDANQGAVPQQVTDMEAWIQDYIDNYDTDEDNRDTKLEPAARWKKEQLILNGVNLLDAVERKVWQDRPDLLTDAEKDTLITAWEAS